ncbi:MAG TPA: hypothetical protein VGL13_00465, partial [Polyangiaceae bacterium]
MAKAKAKTTAKPKGTRKRRGIALKPTGLLPPELAIESPDEALSHLADQVRADGGAVLAAYREPLGGNALLFAALPVDKVEPTPYQREV